MFFTRKTWKYFICPYRKIRWHSQKYKMELKTTRKKLHQMPSRICSFGILLKFGIKIGTAHHKLTYNVFEISTIMYTRKRMVEYRSKGDLQEAEGNVDFLRCPYSIGPRRIDSAKVVDPARIFRCISWCVYIIIA